MHTVQVIIALYLQIVFCASSTENKIKRTFNIFRSQSSNSLDLLYDRKVNEGVLIVSYSFGFEGFLKKKKDFTIHISCSACVDHILKLAIFLVIGIFLLCSVLFYLIQMKRFF